MITGIFASLMQIFFACSLAFCGLARATAGDNCTFTTSGAPASGNVIVSGTTSGIVIMTGTVTVSVHCQVNQTGMSVFLPFYGPAVTPLYNVNGVGITTNGTVTAVGSISANDGGPGCSGINYPDPNFTNAQSLNIFGGYFKAGVVPPADCRMTVTIPFQLVTTGGSVSGTLGPRLTAGQSGLGWGPTPQGWVTAITGSTAPSWFNADSNMPSWTFVPAGCTATVQNTTVTLPNVGVQSLATAGATAGTTPFNLNLVGCTNNSAANVPVYVQWSFTPKVVSGTTYTDVIETAPAVSGLGLQIGCNGNSAAATGVKLNFASLPTGFNNASLSGACWARYIAIGGPASAGAVSANASFQIQYN